jgi:probable phosphoglycerate mutase
MMGSWTDWELTDLGKEHAENIGRKLSAELKGQAYKIYSSDLIRARQTAEPLARYMGIEIKYREKLREINFGEAIGKSKQWAQENRLTINSIDEPEFHGAETWRELWNRVESVCRDIIAGEAENIILVSHGGALAVWHQGLFGFDFRDCKIGPAGGVSFFKITDDGERIIQRLNDLSYIER